MKKIINKVREKRYKSKRPEAIPESAMPRITNDTVAEHREEVLQSARKYIYPLQHSKHKIVVFTTTIIVISLVVFFAYCTAALYKFHATNTFLYKVTQVIPFPVARIGGNFVAYENYLFEVRRYMHYYESQQKLDFKTESGQQQLEEYKKRALEKVIDDAYIKRLAKEHGVTVSNREVDNQIDLLREQNRVGSSDAVLEDVLREYYGWSLNDLKRSIKQQLLAQKLLAALDTETQNRAEQALGELEAGADFAEVARKYSDDPSKDNGGEFGFLIDRSNRDLSPQATQALFSLQPGQYSDIVNTGYSLEIFKVLDDKDGKLQAAHIVLNFRDINEYLNSAKEQQPARTYITLSSPDQETMHLQ